MKKTNQNTENILNDKPELAFITQVLSEQTVVASEVKQSLSNIDNTEFIRLIKHHRLDSIFYNAVLKQQIELPVDLKTKLERINQRNKMRMMQLTAELIRIHKLFTENNIDYISLKGPALSQQIYGDYTIRNSRDLDVLVREMDIDKVVLLLNKNRYKQIENINKRVSHDIGFSNLENNIKLELHHRLFSNRYLMPIKEDIFRTAIHVNLSGHSVFVLNQLDNLKYLVYHGEQHSWANLYWIYDINTNVVNAKEAIYQNISKLIKFTQNKKIDQSIISIIEKQSLMQDFSKLTKLIKALKLKSSFKYKAEVLHLRILRFLYK